MALVVGGNIWSWVRELDVLALDGSASVGNIGNEDAGTVRKLGGWCGTGSLIDGNGSAVHVHLAIADLVEPGPGEQRISSWGIAGDVQVEFLAAAQGAATDVGVDNRPCAALIVGESSLAGSPVVGCSTLDREVGRAASIPGDDGFPFGGAQIRVVSLAGEVGAVSFKRRGYAVVDVGRPGVVGVVGGPEWGRELKRHVGVNSGPEGHCCNEGSVLHLV